MKRKKLVLGSAVALLIALTAWGAWAYFTADATATNVITTGTIGINLRDTMTGATETVAEDGSVVLTLAGVMPGQTVDKTVSVENTGTGDAWIRVIVDVQVKNVAGVSLPSLFETASNPNGLPVVVWPANAGGSAPWFLQEETDGNGISHSVYYYRSGVTAGEATENLFSQVTLNANLPNAYQGCTVDIVVTAQAVQTKNNPGLNADGNVDVTAVAGWPDL